MSRTLNDDFDDDEGPGGSLDLEKGSSQVGSGVPSNYGGDGIDFDDELYGNDEGGGGSLELDLPGGGPHGHSGPPPGPASVRGPSAPQSPTNPPAARLSGSLPAVRPSGSLPAVRLSGSLPAVRPSGSLPAGPGPGQSGQHRAVGTMSAPPPHAPSAPPSEGGHHGFAPPASGSSSDALPASESGPQEAQPYEPPQPPAKPSAAAVIANYPAPPGSVLHAPTYALRVVKRQLELRSELESLRRRRSPDVPLYEAALRVYDAKGFLIGMAINLAVLAIATLIFFLPVMIRFLRAD